MLPESHALAKAFWYILRSCVGPTSHHSIKKCPIFFLGGFDKTEMCQIWCAFFWAPVSLNLVTRNCHDFPNSWNVVSSPKYLQQGPRTSKRILNFLLKAMGFWSAGLREHGFQKMIPQTNSCWTMKTPLFVFVNTATLLMLSYDVSFFVNEIMPHLPARPPPAQSHRARGWQCGPAVWASD